MALSLALLITLPIIAASINMIKANEETGNDVKGWPVQQGLWRNVWYKFETPLITLIFPAGGKKPMFIWWYTNDSSEIYVVKFKGVIEYLTFDTPYYVRQYPADGFSICERIKQRVIVPRWNQILPSLRQGIANRIESMKYLIEYLFFLHPPYLSFSACSWGLEGPHLVTDGNVSYWSFNFTVKSIPIPSFKFAENNIEIRCRFYNTTTTEVIDENHNYTVAAGQLKFDFVVKEWSWNMDRIKPFLDELKDEYGVEVPPHKTGLALWINMASVRLQDMDDVETEIQNQYQNTVEAKSQMRGATINNEYYPVTENKTQNPEEYENGIQLTNQFRERTRIYFARRERTIAGFLEFVPWARLLNETGGTVDYVNVTASYIAAGRHLRLFLCYPYFGNYTLEHDPTIGLVSAPSIPTLIKPVMLMILIGATIAIAIAVATVKLRKKTINIVNIQ
nr:hypothetical protein [Candidatus Njordarchaeota archaeon]